MIILNVRQMRRHVIQLQEPAHLTFHAAAMTTICRRWVTCATSISLSVLCFEIEASLIAQYPLLRGAELRGIS